MLLLSLAVLSLAAPPPEGVGVELGAHGPRDGLIVFGDALRRAHSWRAVSPDAEAFDVGLAVPTDAEGWPLEVPVLAPEGGPARHARAALFDMAKPELPLGRWTLELEGDAAVEIGVGARRHRFEGPGSHGFDVAQSGRVYFSFVRLRPPVQARLRLPHAGEDVLHPLLVHRLSGLSALRFGAALGADDGRFACAEGGPASGLECRYEFQSRTRPEASSQGGGPALEHLLELARRTGAVPWFVLPHAADASAARGLGQWLKAELRPDERVMVATRGPHEGAARAWYAARAEVLGIPGSVGMARLHARVSAGNWTGLEAGLGPEAEQQVVRVLQAELRDMDGLGRALDELKGQGQRVDAVAVDARFGQGAVEAWLVEDGAEGSPEALLRRVESGLEAEGGFADRVEAAAALARTHGATLVARSGGPAFGTFTDAGAATPRILAAQRSQPMARVYRRALELWSARGGGLFVAAPLFGPAPADTAHLTSLAQSLMEAPKFGALRARQRSLGFALQPAWLGTGAVELPGVVILQGGLPLIWLSPRSADDEQGADGHDRHREHGAKMDGLPERDPAQHEGGKATDPSLDRLHRADLDEGEGAQL